ncbi:fibronectin type III domain-containing protein [Actinokineospora bangkokensis]|nr:fibronectin type III domain-containing protein [Actinokineospora bangkokensis]
MRLRVGAGALLLGALLVPGTAQALPQPPTGAARLAAQPYTCVFPVVGAQPVSVAVSADIPVSVPVGSPQDGFAVATAITVPAAVTEALLAAGGSQVSGAAEVSTAVTTAAGPRTVVVHSVVAGSPVPPSGEMVVSATGAFPEPLVAVEGAAQLALGPVELALDPSSAPGWSVDGAAVRVACAPDAPAPAVLGSTEVSAAVDWAGPSGVSVNAVTTTTVALSWTPPEGRSVVGYEVRQGETVVTSVTGNSAVVSGLKPDEDYSFTVQARDEAGARSRVSAPVTTRTKPGVVVRVYDIDARTHARAADASLRFGGRATARVDLDTRSSTIDLELDPTTVLVKLYGVLPMTASVSFEAGVTTASLTDEGLTVSARVSVAVPGVSVFGTRMDTGGSCRTSVPLDVALHSDGAFDLVRGGSVAGTYTIPPMTGCGGLTPMVNGLAAGPGNTLTLQLTARGA